MSIKSKHKITWKLHVCDRDLKNGWRMTLVYHHTIHYHNLLKGLKESS